MRAAFGMIFLVWVLQMNFIHLIPKYILWLRELETVCTGFVIAVHRGFRPGKILSILLMDDNFSNLNYKITTFSFRVYMTYLAVR